MIKNQAAKFRFLDQWFQTAQGMRVAQAFAAELLPIHEFLHGRNLIQLGGIGNNLLASHLNFQKKWRITPYSSGLENSFIASFNALPIARESVDCVLAPLVLEAFTDEKWPLDEIDRVLKSTGFIIFFGINPWSLWGAALKTGIVKCYGYNPVSLVSSFKLKRVMQPRGYHQCLHSSFYYIPPVSKESTIKKLTFVNEMGKMLWPYTAGFYCLILQKHQENPLLLSEETATRALIFDEPKLPAC